MFYSYGVYASQLVIGTIGNGLIIVYFMKINEKKLQKMSSYNFLLTYLAFVDIIISIGSPIFHMNQTKWRSNELVCKYTKIFFDITLPTYSVWLLVTISYERYRKMVHPFKSPMRKKYLSVILALLMVVCTGFYVPVMESTSFMNNQCLHSNSIFDSISAYLIGGICVDCIVPSVLILWFYNKISVKVKSFHRISNELNQNEQQFDNYTRKKVALKTLRTLIILYVLFIYPGRFGFVSINIISFYDPLLYKRHANAFNIILNLMENSVYINNMGNVFIYAWLIVDFRRFLKKVFTFRIFERQNLNRRSTPE